MITGPKKIIKATAMKAALAKTPKHVPVLPVRIDLAERRSTELRKVSLTNILIMISHIKMKKKLKGNYFENITVFFMHF